MRFATRPESAAFVSWAANEMTQILAQSPQAAGLFLDNSNDLAPVKAAGVVEPVTAYSADYAALVNAVAHAVAPHWPLVNTVSGGVTADPLLSHASAYFEEFALRPLSGSFQQFEDLAALTAERATLQTPPPFAVLDSVPAGGSPTDPRTQIATLAEYYLLADPTRTFLDPFGGFAPTTSWDQHFFGALNYNVGQPAGPWSLFASGLDPNDNRFTYRVYERQYGNALVLYKPLSSTPNNSAFGSTSNNTATWHSLDGGYRQLNANGTLGPVVTSLTLRNGEGAILVRA
jgi:hypothetical protein